MSPSAPPRAAALTGLAAFVLILVGLVVSVAAGRPEITLSSTDAEVAAALAEPAGPGVWAGFVLEALGLVALVVFAAVLSALAAEAAPARRPLARAAFGCAVAFAAVSFAALGLGGLIGDRAGAVSGAAELAATDALNDLWGVLYAASWAPCGATLVLLGAALWRTGALPQGVLVAGVLIGVASFAVTVAPASGAGQGIGFLPWLWCAVASGVLVRRAGRAPRRAAVGAAA